MSSHVNGELVTREKPSQVAAGLSTATLQLHMWRG